MNRSPTSLLFVPADRPDRFAKAQMSGADSIVIDLEDSVNEEKKQEARANILAFDATTQAKFWVRINALTSHHFAKDLSVLTACQNVMGVVVSKADNANELVSLFAKTALPMIAVIETAAGLDEAKALAKADGVLALSYGRLDLMKVFGLPDTNSPFFDQVRFRLVLASRLAGIGKPIESMVANFKDTKDLLNTANIALAMGFAGQFCIHPNQVALINASYRPSDEQKALALAILDKHQATGDIAFALDGMMVDLPLIDWARAILTN